MASTGASLLCAAAVVAAIWVYLRRQTTPPPAPSPNALPSLLIPCITSHRRFLPATAIHSFSYPLIYLGLDLEELESGSLDLPASRGFVYGGNPWTSILGIQADSYLDISTPRPDVSFRQRLLGLLASNGVQEHEVGRVWLLTMPSYIGKSGINPLTTYFVYRKPGSEKGSEQREGGLLCVVLEVHNTFEERHLYVLRTGVNEDAEASTSGHHHHRWTFPRSFHVSPFNNRAGYYRLEIQDPFHPSSSTPIPKFKVTLNLLTTSKEPKLFAVLMNHPTQQPGPITLRNILIKVLWKQPLSLLMTTPRILAQAWVLHYRKGLVVYPRPEPEFVGAAASSANAGEEEGDGEGTVTPYSSEDSDTILVPLPLSEHSSTRTPTTPTTTKRTDLEPTWNPVESDLLKVGRTIGWQAVAGTERYAERRLVGPWLRARCEELGVGVRFRFTNQERRELVIASSKGRKQGPTLRITTRHPNFFTQLVCSETPRHFLLAAKADLHTYVSSADLFERVFAPVNGATEGIVERERALSWDEEWAARIRRNHLFFFLSFATKPPPLEILHLPPRHFLHHSPDQSAHHLTLFQRMMVVYIVGLTYGMDRLEQWIMYAANARFVEGQEPWGVWRRVVDSYWRHADVDSRLGGNRAAVAGRGEVAVQRQLEMDKRWGSVVAPGEGGYQ
ncbi:hypothetical protein QFC21_004179 [Naganishia friedmannii]|uniref:Uncharacterized protein n=1 Tax=Naganishia friedmannii TaxID=89922 RepID=A0ACC2VJI1_9TREE|nr:hypothetical protein QFC21_004179 [Naganishia friedmannii]